MKILHRVLFTALVVSTTSSAFAQLPAAERSAQDAAVSDVQFIAANIEYNKGVMFLAQKAKERAGDSRVKELAQQMVEDHSTMLYSMEALRAAGSGSAGGSVNTGKVRDQIAAINAQLSAAKGEGFDTVWVASLLALQQEKYNELTEAKGIATNIQLKTAVSDALPLLRKQISELKSIQKYLLRLAIQEKKEAEREAKEKARRERP